jgi:hypothetical protein
LQARLGLELQGGEEPETEMQYSLPDVWSVRIFVALCRKRGIRPYRYPRQRRTTVIVRVRQSSFDETVGEEFRTLHRELTAYFSEMVEHLIAMLCNRTETTKPSSSVVCPAERAIVVSPVGWLGVCCVANAARSRFANSRGWQRCAWH